MNDKIRIIFAGTPDFAVPYLEGLINDPAFFIMGAITQPDKPSGRKQQLSPSPVKLAAQKYRLNIWQPDNLKTESELAAEIKAVGADLLVVVAYGQIIPQSILRIFPRGAINVHPSLLPKYRGASPIQSALLAGEAETGISIMLMDEMMDHGPILAQEIISLTGDETNESLHNQLAGIGVNLLIGTIRKYLSDEIKPQPQNDSEATYCATIAKEQARINWQDPAKAIKQKIYAFYPWPAAWTMLDGQRLKIFPPIAVKKADSDESGKIEIVDNELIVNCGQEKIALNKLQLEGKNQISATDFIRGHKEIAGKKFK